MAQQNNKCKICGSESRLFLDNLFDDRYGASGKYSIYKCSDCDFAKIIPQLRREEIGKFYAKYYPLLWVDKEKVRKDAKIHDRLFSWLNGTDNMAHHYITGGSKVLDIGSGSGVSLLEIEKLGGEAYGAEPDHNAQKIARELNLRLYHGFITDNPFPKIKFDYITASQVIEHDPDPKTFFQAVYKHLKEDGKVILGFPNVDAFYRKIFKRRWLHWHVPYHCNFFSKNSFVRLANLSGFKITKIKTITPNLWTILQLQMLLISTKEGKQNPIWVKQTKASYPKFNCLSFCKIPKLLLFILLYPPITIVNRIIDYLGFGESFLVFLEKKK